MDDRSSTLSKDIRAGLAEFLERASPPEVIAEQERDHEPPLALLKEMGRLGYLAVGLPEHWGGSGDMLDITAMIDELSYRNQALAHLVGRSMYALQNLVDFGTEEQQRRWMPPLLAGEIVFAIGMTEPEAGSDAAAITTRAVAQDDGSWLVNGRKVFTSSAGYAGLIMLAARTGTRDERHSGITTFLVDATSPGIDCAIIDTIGYWSVGVYSVGLSDVVVPPGSVLGEVGGGWGVLRKHLVRERLTIAARAVGAMRQILELSIEYANSRKQFGQPISNFQAIQHKLADIRIDYQMAHTAVYDLARRVVEGTAKPTDAAVVKTFASEAWVRCSDRAMQIFGGYGYTLDYPIQRHFRDSRVSIIGGGTSEIMRNLIAKDLIRPR